jgi:hypothetical protein
MIRPEMAELLKQLPLLTRPSLRESTGIFFEKEVFSELFKTYMNRLSFLSKKGLKYTKTVFREQCA